MSQPARPTPFIVGLTGGIGSGKSSVARLFARLGAEVIDADDISRELVAPGTPALAAIVRHFGPDLLDEKGELRRAELRTRIFHDPAAKKWLELQLHPRIRETIAARIERSTASWLLLCVPLLLESRGYDFVDRVLVVDASEQQQIARTIARDHTDEETVRRIMTTQLARERRIGKADDVIDNTGDEAFLEQQVLSLFNTYEELAHARHQAG